MFVYKNTASPKLLSYSPANCVFMQVLDLICLKIYQVKFLEYDKLLQKRK